MSTKHDEHVLPRPVERLPEYANAKARASAAEKLESLFGMSPDAARVIANAVVDPAELRKVADAPEYIAVPGGTLIGLRTDTWSRRITPDPRNPRLGPARRHPAAVEPGTAEDSRFRPVAEPTSDGTKPEHYVEIESREHLTWAVDQSRHYILSDNDWRQSIRSQGVMTELWATATAYAHEDGSPPVWTVTTAEGSSRITCVHDILDERSVDLAYDLDDRQMRTLVRRHNEAFDRGASPETLVAMRCEIVPVLFLVGFSTHPGGTPDFATAVKSLVALRHVDPPKPWGEGPEMEALADAALEELQRRSVLTPQRRRWMAGGMTPAEASQAHLSSDPAVRAAAIVELFYSDDATVRDAMRMAITAQSTRKNLSPRLKSQLATALIVRSVPAAGDNGDRIRRYMQTAFAKPVREEAWQATTRSADELLAAALAEVAADDAGAATLELAARGAYPLITTLRLWADRGTRDNEQPDRRSPGEVIDTMRRTIRGVQQLGHALNDHAAGQKIRVVDADGAVVRTEDGAQDVHVTDTWIRHEFPAAGTIKAPASPNTAREKLQAKLADLGAAVEAVTSAMDGVRSIEDVDGSSLVDSEGVDRRHTTAWRELLVAATDELLLWGAKWRPLSSANGVAVVDDDQDETGIDDEQDAA